MKIAIHNKTAKFLGDIAQPPVDDLELKEPDPIRRYSRLVAITVAGVLILAAIVVMAMRIPKLQSEMTAFSTSDSSTTAYTDEVKKFLADAVISKSPNINCPCQLQEMSWCNVTIFHIYTVDEINASTPAKVYNFTKDEGGENLATTICKSRDDLTTNICNQILSPVLNSKDSRTFLQTARAFTAPELLYQQIANRIDTNAYEQLSVHYYLAVNNNTQHSYNYSEALVHLVRNMHDQFIKNSSSSTEEYWNASRETRAEFKVGWGYGMDVSWEVYLQTCKPAFCDVEYEISVLNRVLRAMGQVGGITTVVTLALKFFIWPSLKLALRFPTSKPPESNV